MYCQVCIIKNLYFLNEAKYIKFVSISNYNQDMTDY